MWGQGMLGILLTHLGVLAHMLQAKNPAWSHVAAVTVPASSLCCASFKILGQLCLLRTLLRTRVTPNHHH